MRFAILILLFLTFPGQAQHKDDSFINAATVQKSRAYSHGIIISGAGVRLMTSGIIGTDKNGELVTSSPRGQIRQAFENIEAILASAGAGIDDIIEIETFLVDTNNFLDYALERRDFFAGRKTPPPISKTYYAKGLINSDAIVELAVMANVRGAKGADSAVYVTAMLKAKTGKEDELRSQLKRNIEPSRNESGCVFYELYQSDDDPGVFTLHEKWVNKDALNRHFQQPYMKRLSEEAKGLIEKSEINIVRRVEP